MAPINLLSCIVEKFPPEDVDNDNENHYHCVKLVRTIINW